MVCAIIDVGSNTIHMVLYQLEASHASKIISKKESVGLLSYLENARLSEKGIERAAEVLRSFAHTLQLLHVSNIHCFATAALRGLRNEADVLSRLRDASGLVIHVIDGQEEAELGLYSLMRMPYFDPAEGLVFDMGGGSCELTFYENGQSCVKTSLPLGSLLLNNRFVTGLFPSRQECDHIAGHVRRTLKDQLSGPLSSATVFGIGGTVRALSKLDRELTGRKASVDGYVLTRERLTFLEQWLSDSSLDIQRQIMRLVPDRIQTLIPGCVAISEIVTCCGGARLIVSARGVREGYLSKYILSNFGG